MRVLILGGSGFIGIEVCRALHTRGHQITALARNIGRASRRMIGIDWLRRDLRDIRTAGDWSVLSGFDAVVNCAGALQDGADDNVVAVQRSAMLALYEAAPAAGVRLIVQISAQTDGPHAHHDFLSSKQQADEALRHCGVPFVILRPAVVIGRNAHGGSALLRALAAMPYCMPLVHPETPMQFVSLDDVVDAVAEAVDGRIAVGSDIALASPEMLPLRDAVARHRAWLGLPPARVLALSASLAQPVSAVADLLGRLGWRSPLRSTAIDIAAAGMTATISPVTPEHRPLASLAETLGANPSGVQDLWFARLYLLKPLIIGILSLFWLLSGVIALMRFDVSSSLLAEALGSRGAAGIMTVLTSITDIALGVAILIRRHARPALIGMVLVSLCYLATATLLAPYLWLDPLGPLVKVLPSIVLAAVTLAILDER